MHTYAYCHCHSVSVSVTVTEPKSGRLCKEKMCSLEAHKDYVLSVAFSPDSKMVATASGDKTAILWMTALENAIAHSRAASIISLETGIDVNECHCFPLRSMFKQIKDIYCV